MFFLVAPWLRFHDQPLLLLNLFERRFIFFGIHLVARDAPLAVFPILSFVTAFAWLTVLFGRVWCGWLCPQTIFIEGVFRKIESWIEGDARKRRAATLRPLDATAFFLKFLKWSSFLLASLLITHSFLALFVGSESLLEIIKNPPSQHPLSFAFILLSTGVILFNFGWLREQFCIAACPYGKIQSILVDAKSWMIAYDPLRGEPRRDSGKEIGDCINCYKCVEVCPTGIDIRNGGQLECIGCAACIDTCNEVMLKIKKPLGLIRYQNLSNKIHFKDAKPLILLLVSLIMFLVPIGVLSLRSELGVEIYKVRGMPFEEVSGFLINRFHADFINRTENPLEISIESSDPRVHLVFAEPYTHLQRFEQRRVSFAAEFNSSVTGSQGKTDLVLRLKFVNSKQNPVELVKDITLIGPLK